MVGNCSLRWGTGMIEIDKAKYQNWGSYSGFKKRVITPKLKYAITLLFFDQFQPNLGFG
jgi:hypothetical protein